MSCNRAPSCLSPMSSVFGTASLSLSKILFRNSILQCGGKYCSAEEDPLENWGVPAVAIYVLRPPEILLKLATRMSDSRETVLYLCEEHIPYHRYISVSSFGLSSAGRLYPPQDFQLIISRMRASMRRDLRLCSLLFTNS